MIAIFGRHIGNDFPKRWFLSFFFFWTKPKLILACRSSITLLSNWLLAVKEKIVCLILHSWTWFPVWPHAKLPATGQHHIARRFSLTAQNTHAHFAFPFNEHHRPAQSLCLAYLQLLFHPTDYLNRSCQDCLHLHKRCFKSLVTSSLLESWSINIILTLHN